MRKYSGSQSRFLEQASTVHSHLETDLTDFSKHDPKLNEEKRSRFGDYIKRAFTISPDRVVVSGIVSQTNLLKKSMSDARDACNNIFYFAERKFANKPTVQSEFGKSEFQKVNRNQPNFALYLHHFAKTVDKYRVELLEDGASEDLLNSIPTLAEKVNSTNVVQENTKNLRPLSTKERNDYLNDIYEIMKEFNKASKIVYANDPIKRKRYNLTVK
jgi:hypothetical protein